MRRLFDVLVALSVLFVSSTAHAELLRITPLGFSPAGYLGQTDPVLIGSEGFRLTYHSQGNNNPWVNPVELILAIPESEGLFAPLLTVSSSSGVAVSIDLGGTSTMYGGSWDTTTGFAGTFTGTPISKVYDFIGFDPDGSASQNFTNWSGYSGVNSWNLFVYALTISPHMKPTDYIEFSSSPNLPVGTFVIGYGQEEVKKGTCGNPSCAQSTPFTFAGYVPEQSVPEPASSLLLGSGLGLLLMKIRRRTRTRLR